MKKAAVILVVLFLVGSLAGCGAIKKAKEKAAGETAEYLIEDATGGKAKVQIDGDTYTIEDQDGNKMEVGSNEWPTDEAADFIPEFDDGTIISCTSVEGVYLVIMESVAKADYESYLQEVIDAGFTEDVLSVSAEEGENYYQYTASDGDGNGIMLSYELNSENLQIMGTAASNN